MMQAAYRMEKVFQIDRLRDERQVEATEVGAL